MPPAPQTDAEYGVDEDLAAQVARMNAEAMPPPPPEPEPAPAKQGGLFARIMRKKGAAPSEPEAAPPPPSAPPEMAPPPPEMAPPPQGEAAFGGAAPQDASFDAGVSEEEREAALADPDLVAAAFGEAPPKKAKAARKPLPVVAIGWGVLALLVAIVLGLFVFAPNTTVSILPGASRVYGMLGIPVGTQGLAFEGVRYGWTNDGSQTVLEVQGNVRNTGSTTMTVPTVVIALRDENGQEISEWTTEVGAAELEAGEEAPFLRQIPSPPSNVRSLKVRFAEAN
jgi:hypothetical protein